VSVPTHVYCEFHKTCLRKKKKREDKRTIKMDFLVNKNENAYNQQIHK
jgi:hypothetical protein